MLAFLRNRGGTSDRKRRLFACACCRRIWRALTHPRAREAVEVAERFADGGASQLELIRAERAAWSVRGECPAALAAWACTLRWAADAARRAAGEAERVKVERAPGAVAAERLAQAELLRDITGSPF